MHGAAHVGIHLLVWINNDKHLLNVRNILGLQTLENQKYVFCIFCISFSFLLSFVFACVCHFCFALYFFVIWFCILLSCWFGKCKQHASKMLEHAKKCKINANKMTPNLRSAKQNAKRKKKAKSTKCKKTCEQHAKKKKCEQNDKKHDSRAGKITFFGFSNSAPDPGTCAWQNGKKPTKNNDKQMTNKWLRCW